jgi:hypothetical protein
MCPHDSAFAVRCESARLVRVAWHSLAVVGSAGLGVTWPGHDPADRGSAQLSRAASERDVLLRIERSRYHGGAVKGGGRVMA